MSHNQPYFARHPGPPTQAQVQRAAPIYSSARPVQRQNAYATHVYDHKHPQPQPPPKHPVQQQRAQSVQGGQGQVNQNQSQVQAHVPQPQSQPGASGQTQMHASYQRPGRGAQQQQQQQKQQFGVVQQPYNPPYVQAQIRPGAAPAPAPAPVQRGTPALYTGQPVYPTQSQAQTQAHASPMHHTPTQPAPYPYSVSAPGQAPQRTYSYPPPVAQPVQPAATRAPAQGAYAPPTAQSAYARGLSVFQQQQQQQQQYPPTSHPAPATQQYAQARPQQHTVQVPPPSNTRSPSVRRPLPTPGPSGLSPSRARPMSMPPQSTPTSTYQQHQPPSVNSHPYSHSSSSSLSHIVPTSSFSSTSSSSLPPASSNSITSSFPNGNVPRNASPTRRPLPSLSPSPSPSPRPIGSSAPPTTASIGIPRTTNMQFPQTSSSTKSVPVPPSSLPTQAAGPSTSTSASPQRRPRALPTSPTGPPDLSQVGSSGLTRRGTVSAVVVSKLAGTGTSGPPIPTKATSAYYTPSAPVRASTLPVTNVGPPATQRPAEAPYEESELDASFSEEDEDEETSSSLYGTTGLEPESESEAEAERQITIANLEPTSPQYGILDLPSRRSTAPAPASAERQPQSPQYGILDLPKRSGSVYDQTRVWEERTRTGAGAGQNTSARGPPWSDNTSASITPTRGDPGSVDLGTSCDTRRSGPAPAPTSLIRPSSSSATTTSATATATLLNPVSTPISPSKSKSPQPQRPQQETTLPMPPVRHPQPSRTERTPSWTLPSADLDKIQVRTQVPPTVPLVSGTGGTGTGTSMAFRFATMSLSEDASKAVQDQTQLYQNPAPGPSVSGNGNGKPGSTLRQTSPVRSSAYEQAMQFQQAQKSRQKEEERQQRQQAQPPLPRSQPPSRAASPSKTYPPPFSSKTPRATHANLDLSLDDAPPPPLGSLRRSPSPSPSTATSSSSSVPSIPTIRTPDDGPVYASVSGNGSRNAAGGHVQVQAQGTALGFQIPVINLPGDVQYDDDDDDTLPPDVGVAQGHAPNIVVSPKPLSPQKPPIINLPDDDFDDFDPNGGGLVISVSAPPASTPATPAMPVILNDLASVTSPNGSPTKSPRSLPRPPPASTSTLPSNSTSSSNPSSGSTTRPRPRGGGLVCGGCHQSIIGRIVSAMGLRWHPQCFKCCTCGELLEHVSSYEHDGKPYCHLDYHELFAPRCYHCKTPIIDERFITLDDPALGKRAYHEQHFFCAECGDPFLSPSSPSKTRTSSRPPLNSHSHPNEDPNEIAIKGDGAFDVALDEDGDEVGFTVYRGHPYCEACHVRLRAPKCKACKRSIRDGMRAVEALGGKWCFECFVCAGCQKPFEEPSFFQRDRKPYCEPCFSLILRNEI